MSYNPEIEVSDSVSKAVEPQSDSTEEESIPKPRKGRVRKAGTKNKKVEGKGSRARKCLEGCTCNRHEFTLQHCVNLSKSGQVYWDSPAGVERRAKMKRDKVIDVANLSNPKKMSGVRENV